MKVIRLKRFLKSRKFRRMYLKNVKETIKNCVKTPFMYFKAVYDTIKLYIDYPDKWDRYVEFREMENKVEIKKAKETKAIAYIKLTGAFYMFDVALLSYCSYLNRDDLTKEDYEILFSDFKQFKEEFKKYASELEEMGVVIPKELKSIVEETKIDRFNNFTEYKQFSNQIEDIFNKIDVTFN